MKSREKILYTLLKVCCKCKKLLGIETHENNHADKYIDVSHGYCPKCFREAMKEVEEFKRTNLERQSV